ncbi:TrkA domain protein [Arthrobacter silviterrae]|uniref:Cation:proton antiporter regulatory subunit n=1 Tax=Arthrobacter silviterrae TaxID=2026658 RepID=A0ABX0D9L9_9MICC|nr:MULTISPECIES: cation:proton antiporter regulatory subunit [Arthrobacter]MCU6479627.1 potassium transporter TrkA [Arthrobacter sp. A2-55]MDQ0278039.1 TrkA domain protein [Arthrobacter silviterrae]NGN83593.1 cation:proton antiporter regulatory subunit [Arthrobacter silviterrae]
MNIEETPLPGIGVRRELRLGTGRRVGVVTHRDGHTELILSRVDDPDTCAASIPLSAEEASALGSLLGSAQLIAQLAAEQKDVPGVTTHQILVRPGSTFAERPLGDTQMRTRTGTSIVALLRDHEVIGSPRPDEVLKTGDMVVIVGTDSGLLEAAAILQSRP